MKATPSHSTSAVLTTTGLKSRPTSYDQYVAARAFIALNEELSQPFQALMYAVFDSQSLWESFVQAPSSVQGHHAEPGGNLIHTVEVAQVSLQLASNFCSLVDRDVVLAGALLHDIGKTYEYTGKDGQGYAMSDTGHLIGHKATGIGIVWNAIHQTPGLSDQQRNGLLNCISSSDGKSCDLRGRASLEAEIINKADQLSASAYLYGRSRKMLKKIAGFGDRHPHQRETPLHILPKTEGIASSSSGPIPQVGSAIRRLTAMERLVKRCQVEEQKRNQRH